MNKIHLMHYDVLILVQYTTLSGNPVVWDRLSSTRCAGVVIKKLGDKTKEECKLSCETTLEYVAITY